MCRERLIGGEDQRGPAALRDDIRHRERLARPRDAQKRLKRQAVANAFNQTSDRLRLISGGRERLVKTKRTARKGEHRDEDLSIKKARMNNPLP